MRMQNQCFVKAGLAHKRRRVRSDECGVSLLDSCAGGRNFGQLGGCWGGWIYSIPAVGSWRVALEQSGWVWRESIEPRRHRDPRASENLAAVSHVLGWDLGVGELQMGQVMPITSAGRGHRTRGHLAFALR